MDDAVGNQRQKSVIKLRKFAHNYNKKPDLNIKQRNRRYLNDEVYTVWNNKMLFTARRFEHMKNINYITHNKAFINLFELNEHLWVQNGVVHACFGAFNFIVFLIIIIHDVLEHSEADLSFKRQLKRLFNVFVSFSKSFFNR